jgi:hypothetical protein
MLVILSDLHSHLWDLMLLVAVDDPQVTGSAQINAALTAPLGQPVLAIIGILGPGQMRPGRPALLAPRPRRTTLAALVLVLRRRSPARIIIFRPSSRC